MKKISWLDKATNKEVLRSKWRQANTELFAALKQAAKDRQGWRHTEGISKQKTVDDDDDQFCYISYINSAHSLSSPPL